MTRKEGAVMSMMMFRAVAAGLALLAAGVGVAEAQLQIQGPEVPPAQPPPNQAPPPPQTTVQPESQNFRALLQQGFEVRSVFYVPKEAANRIGTGDVPDAVMLTAQKGTTLAVCYTELRAYANGSFLDLPCRIYQ